MSNYDTVGFVIYHIIYGLRGVYLLQVMVYGGLGTVWEKPTWG